MSKPPDWKEREQIRNVLDRNVMVEAAAGTGKTTALIERIIEVIVRGIARVPSIAALTFTEKAAGELKLRLRSELEKARTKATNETLPRIEQALLELEEARVSTIHTFCADLLRERPVEACVDPAFRTLGEAEGPRLLRTSVDLWLQQKLADPPDGLRRLLRRLPRRDSDPIADLRKAVQDIADWRDFSGRWERDPFDRADEIRTLLGQLHSFAQLLRDCSDPGNDNLFGDTKAALHLADELQRYDALGARDDDYFETRLINLLYEKNFKKPRGRKSGKFGPVTKCGDVRDAHAALLGRLQSFELLANADLAAALREELGEAVEFYEEQKRRLGALDFTDLLLSLRDLLQKHAAVRAHFQDRIRHLFVDEFQDTDPIQVEILMLLASDDPSVSDWRLVRPKPGKLFLVGDPKQSIYRFRRADLGMYAGVKEHLRDCGALILDLSTSFRSLPDIQGFANGAFGKLMSGDRDEQQADYVPLKQYRGSRGDQPAVVALPVPDPYSGMGVTEWKIDESLPDVVGAYVKWLVDESGWKVTSREKPGEWRNVDYHDVCILFRRFETWGYDGKRSDVTRKYVQCLEARGIPQLLVGGKAFHGREEIETMRTALAAIEWPEDELSIYATLRGSLFGITDEELLEYRHRYQRLKPFAIPGDLPEHLRPIGDALRFLATLHRGRNYRPVADSLRRLFTETRCHAGFVMRPSGKQVLANVMQLIEQARVYDESGALSFRGFIEQLLDEAEHSRASEAPVLEEGSEGVRLMTVHKAKGLEFPVVILADITCNDTRGRASRYVDADRNLAAMQLCGLTPIDLIRHEPKEVARDRSEAVRLAYVAATRARDLLVIPAVADERLDGKWLSVLNDAIFSLPGQRLESNPGCPDFGKDSTVRPWKFVDRADTTVKPGTYQRDGYAITWWDSKKLGLNVPIMLGIPQRELLGPNPPAGVLEADRERYASWRGERDAIVQAASSPAIRVETAIERSMRRADAPEVEIVSIDGRGAQHGARYGSLLHAILASVDLDASRDAIRRVTELQSRILGAPLHETESAVTAVEALLAHPLMRRASKSIRMRREVPLTLIDGDDMIEGITDLAFEEVEGWTVVDFKTDAEIAGRIEAYKRQVSIYAGAIAKATGRSASGVLVQL